MALEKIGGKIVLEGEKEYRRQLKEIGSEQKELRSELQLTSAEYAENQNSLEALTSKYDILGRQVEEQAKKVKVYEDAVAETKKVQQEAADSVEQYTSELDDARAELEKMKASEDASSESIKAQEERVKELEQALAKSEDRYSQSTQLVNNWQTGLNVAQASLINLQNDLDKTSKYLDEANNSTDKCAHSIDAYGKSTKEAEENTLTFGEIAKANLASDVVMKGLETMVGLIKQAGEGLFELATSAAYYADNVNTMSTQTGVATDTIQALMYSEELLDVSVNTVTSSMAKNVRSMQQAANGSAQYADSYKKLGVQVTDSNGQLRDSETVFWEMIDALGQMENATERDAISMQLFGRSAQQLNPLIKAGSSGFNDLKKEATDLGYVLDTDTLDSLNETSDAMERLSKYGDTIKKEIGASMGEEVAEGAEKILEVIKKNEDKLKNIAETVIPAVADAFVGIIENIDKLIPLVGGLVAGLLAYKAAGVAVAVVNTVMATYTAITEGATVAQLALNGAMAANPIGLLVAGLTAAGVALATYIGQQKTAVSEFADMMKQIDADTESIASNIEARKKQQSDMAASKTVVANLKDELMKLNSQTSLTADEQNRMKIIVDELNEAMPDLNLSIDEQTGKLSQSAEELDNNIEKLQEYYKLLAAREDALQISKDLYDAEKQLAQIQEERTELEEKLAEASKNASGLSLISDYTMLEGEIAKLNSSEETQLALIDELTGEFADNQEVVSNLSSKYADFEAESSDSIQKVDKTYTEYHGHLITMTGEDAEALKELKGAYEEAKSSAKDSLESQIGLFDELTNKSDLSVQQMKSNLESQTEVMLTYKDDMLKAADLVEQGLMDEGLLGKIEEMGIAGAGYLHELVTAAEEDQSAFQATMDAFADQQAAADALAETMADIQTNFSETQEAIIEDMLVAQDTISENAEHWKENHKELWEKSYDGANEAILKRHDKIVNSAGSVTDDALKKSKDVLKIDENGKSAETEKVGVSYVESMADAILNNKDMLISAVDTVTSEALNRAKSRVAEINRLLGESM